MNQASLLLQGLIPYLLRGSKLYLGHQSITPEEWGNYLYIETSRDDALSILENSNLNPVIVNDNLYRLDISSDTYLKIIKPFLKGKYSLVDKEYVKNNFEKSFKKVGKDWKPE